MTTQTSTRSLVELLSEFERDGADIPAAVPGISAGQMPMLRDLRFELRLLLGAGASGSVCEKFAKDYCVIVTVKVLQWIHPDSLSCFSKCRTLRRLRHPNHVSIAPWLKADPKSVYHGGYWL